jgi:hypothetical protein
MMEMAVRSMKTAETVMETDGDGSGGTSLSRQGTEIETSVPRNSSVVAAELWNCSGKNDDCFRVFCREALYRRRGVVRSGPGWSHCRLARPGAGPCPLVVRLAPGPPPSHLRSWSRPRKIGVWVFVSSNSKNISYVAFLKHKNSRKQGTGTVVSCQWVSSGNRIKTP